MLIYTDQFEAYNAASGLKVLDYAATIFAGFTCKSYNGGAALDGTFSIVTGLNTDTGLLLWVANGTQLINTDRPSSLALLRPTTNKTATHWASFDFKWHNDSTDPHPQPFAFFGFNDAAVTNQWGTHVAAPVVTLTQDGAVHVGGNASAAGIIPVDTSVHVDIEVLTAAAQINVYVGGSLVVSSPTDLAWLLGGLTALGPRCDPWPVSGDAGGKGMILSEHFDNLTLYDSTGTTFNSRLASGVTYGRFPLASQVDANFTNVGGAASTLAALSDHSGAAFNTTTYAKSPVDNDLADTFKVDTSSIGALDTILGVSIVNLARRNALGNRHIETRIKNGANVVDINHTPQTPIGFTTSSPVFAEKAPDGSAWTLASLGATEFGYVVKAS